jgi:hypothetical protein
MMAGAENTIPEILGSETHEQNSAARTAVLEKLEVSKTYECLKAKDEYDESKHKKVEISEKVSDLDYNIRVLENRTQHLQQKNEELNSEIDKILWSQNQAKLTLASQQVSQNEIIQTMERHREKVKSASNEVDSSEEIFNKEQVLIEKIFSLKKELQAKKLETEQNELKASQIEQENLILRKRNQAMLVRLGRQHQEAEFRHQQILNKLTTLRKKLETNATNIGQDKEGN